MSRERGIADGDGVQKRSKAFRARSESASRFEKLQSHPIFKEACLQEESEKTAIRPRLGLNLVASDGRGHLFVWNSKEKLLHYVDVQHSDSLNANAGAPSLFASKTFKTCKSSPEIDFNVRCIVFNRTGRSLAMAGDTGLVVVDLVPHLSAPSDSSGSVTVCRIYQTTPSTKCQYSPYLKNGCGVSHGVGTQPSPRPRPLICVTIP